MRSLYQCSHPKCFADNFAFDQWDYGVYCEKGHSPLIEKDRNGNSHIIRYSDLKDGDSLECDTCEGCKDFSDMGSQVPEGERGW